MISKKVYIYKKLGTLINQIITASGIMISMYKMTMNKRFNDCPCIQKDSRMHIPKNSFSTIKCHNFKNKSYEGKIPCRCRTTPSKKSVPDFLEK